VHAGDLVVADSTGVCVVPAGRAAEVLERCEAIEAAEAALLERLAAERAGLPGG
jgi:4-hydroxy-4-methyl-2-oxoglutarate aldolase